MQRTVTLGWRSLGLFALGLLALGGLLGMLAVGMSSADDHPPGSSEVRLLAERLEDGRVEVALQQRSLDGSWDEVYEPMRRFVPADLEPGRRLHSSPIDLAIDDGRGAAQLALFNALYEEGVQAGQFLSAETDAPVLCVNLESRGEDRGRLCEGLVEGYPGTVNRLDESDPDQLSAELAVRIAAGEAEGGFLATSYAAVILAGRVAQTAVEAGQLDPTAPLYSSGSLLNPIPPDPDARYCAIHHGGPGIFWASVEQAAGRAADYLGISLAGLRVVDQPDQDPAGLIRRCVAGGAAAIALTLADPDAVREAIAEARAAGVRVTTLNSGADFAAELGSAIHISADERAIGRKAGEAFTRQGASGDILCIIHEAGNIALGERCEALDEAYAGGVQVLPLYEADSIQSAVGMIATALSSGEIGGVLTLDATYSELAFQAAAFARADVKMGTVGFGTAVYERGVQGDLHFVIWDQAFLQGYLAVAAMVLADQLTVDPTVWFGGARLSIEPQVFEREDLIRLFDELAGPER